MFAIIETRTLLTTPEKFEHDLKDCIKSFKYVGWFKSTQEKNKQAVEKIMADFLEECNQGLTRFSTPKRSQVSETYESKDLCSQVFDLQEDKKTTTNRYWCTGLLPDKSFRPYYLQLDPLLYNPDIFSAVEDLYFKLQFNRTVEEVNNV